MTDADLQTLKQHFEHLSSFEQRMFFLTHDAPQTKMTTSKGTHLDGFYRALQTAGVMQAGVSDHTDDPETTAWSLTVNGADVMTLLRQRLGA